MIRDDLSDKLIHLVRGETTQEAFGKLTSILSEGRLRGGTGFIKGSHTCVCFTEAPLAKLGYVFANPDLEKMKIRYRPFGIMIDKRWLFESGGRPVIYQPDSDYEKLHNDHKYRHVRFELNNPDYPIDLTWEREWRILRDFLELPQDKTTVVVPNRHYKDTLVAPHYSGMQRCVDGYGSEYARFVEPYPWHLLVLEDLGIPIAEGLK